MQHPALYVVLSFTTAAVIVGWGYFQRYQLTRPPIGVMTLGDVAVMIGATVIVPYLYLAVPLWLVVGFFALGVLCVLYTVGEPALHARWPIWLLALLLPATDVGTNVHFGATSSPFLLVNDLVLTLVIVGVANLWAQSGSKARDVALLAGALAVYDVIATSFLPVTTDLFHHLAGMPLNPELVWSSGSDRLGIGLGDMLLVTVFPLVMQKAFCPRAGRLAAGFSLTAIAVMSTAIEFSGRWVTIPLMSALGPLMIAQYCFWRWRRGPERTMWQYVSAEPRGYHGVMSDRRPDAVLADTWSKLTM